VRSAKLQALGQALCLETLDILEIKDKLYGNLPCFNGLPCRVNHQDRATVCRAQFGDAVIGFSFTGKTEMTLIKIAGRLNVPDIQHDSIE
jgi:hypothetical protein